MMYELIEKSDPRYFTCTSDESYDRHTYKLVGDDKKSVIFDSYEHLRLYWFENARNWKNCSVQVLDKKKGF